MKQALRTMLAAIAAAAAIGNAHAQSEFYSGSGTLAFSQAARDALDASGVFISTYGAGNKAAYDEASDSVALAFTAGAISGENIRSLTSTGSYVLLERTVTKQGRLWVDNIVTLSDFVFDLSTKTLSSGVKGTNLLTGVVTDYGFRPVFSAASLEGGEIVDSGEGYVDGAYWGKTSGQTTGALTINLATADAFLTILGLPLTGGVADLVKNSDWGVASASAVTRYGFPGSTPVIPEPAAYLSALAGLAILGVARLRAK